MLSFADGPSVNVREVASVLPRGQSGPAGGPAARAALRPVGFSVDERWIYADAFGHVPGVAAQPAARISAVDGTAEPLDAFPTSGPERLVSAASEWSSVDRVNGRRIGRLPTGVGDSPRDLVVEDGNGERVFGVAIGVVTGTAWLDDGGLLAMAVDRLFAPGSTQLVVVSPDGTVGSPLLETGAVDGAGLVGVVDGHALLGYSAGGAVLVVVLRLADGATATVHVLDSAESRLELVGWGE